MVDLTHPKDSSALYRRESSIHVGFAAMGRWPAGERTSMVDRRLREESSGWCRRGVGIRVESVPMKPLPAGVMEEGGVSTHQTERL